MKLHDDIQRQARMPAHPVWREDELRAVALAYRSACLKGHSAYEAVKAALKVIARCYPDARSEHGRMLSSMLIEASSRWGPWLRGTNPGSPPHTPDTPKAARMQ